MCDKKTYIFFRNDDVRDIIEPSLHDIINIFIINNIPISLAVEPANLNLTVVEWLKKMKANYPGLIDIMQHGYNHKNNLKYKQGEFGKGRTFQEQYNDIYEGKKLMDKYFGSTWLNAFSFPFGTYDENSMLALSKCGYEIVTGNYGSGVSRYILYNVGKLLKKEMFLGYRIPYDLVKRPKSGLFQVNTNISPIIHYINKQNACTMHSFSELKTITNKLIGKKAIGVVLHHRYHNDKDKIQIIEDYLSWVKDNKNLTPISIKYLYHSMR
ncbi:MAG: DUF2334 domain-containing protein [Bacteroidales bacterium]|nr:DUF2334 domain-containing protein [Bacteroidales bacterium]